MSRRRDAYYPFQNAAELNAEAVSLIVKGEYANAISMLRSALESSREGYNGVTEDSSVAIDLPTKIESILFEFVPPNISGGTGMFTVFNRALVVTGSAPANSHKTTGSILYNIALCHHIRGMKLGSSEELAKALQFYHMAFSVVSNACDERSLEDEDTILILALLNNSGHIHASFFNQNETHHCHELLQRCFESSEGSSLMQDDSLFFYITSHIVKLEGFVSAPAA